jgi:hypothetical protein
MKKAVAAKKKCCKKVCSKSSSIAKSPVKAMNVVQKILSTHIVEGDPQVDRELGIRIDQTLTQDATGTMA